MKGCALPNHCEAVAPLLNKETMEEEYHVFPVLLPHELLAHAVKEDPDLLAASSAKPRGNVIHCAALDWCQTFQVEPFQDAATGVAWRRSSFCCKDERHFGVPQLEHPHK